MADIIWGRERPYTGNGECPADAADVACCTLTRDGWYGDGGGKTGAGQPGWRIVTAYRLPAWFDAMEDAREDLGHPG